MNYVQRLVAFLLEEDEAVNVLGGGRREQTVSGTIGRGLIVGRWWAPVCAAIVDGLFGKGHCARIAAREAHG